MTFSSDLIFDAAVLSSKVYDNDFPPDVEKNFFINGWRLLSREELKLGGADFDWVFPNNFLYSKLDAQAFVAIKGTDMAIVFRGTSSIGDLLADGTLPAIINTTFALFAPLVAAFKAYADTNGASNTYAFGHSLGGAMVEMLLANENSYGFQGVTFRSPGINLNVNLPNLY